MEGNKTRKTLKYQRKLYSMFISSLLIPMAVAGIIFLAYFNYSVAAREKQDMKKVLESVAQNIDMKFKESIQIGNSYYTQQVFPEAELLNNPRLFEFYDELARGRMESDYSQTITKQIHTSTQVVRSVVFFPMDQDDDIGYYLGRDRSILTEVSYPDYHEEQWFHDAVHDPYENIFCKPHIPPYDRNRNRGEVYSYIRALENVDNQKIVGVVKIDVDTEQLQNMLDVLGDDSSKALVLSKGKEVFMKSSSLEGVKNWREKQYQKETITVPETDMMLTYLYSNVHFYRAFLLVVLVFIGFVVFAAGLAFFIYHQKTKELLDDLRKVTEVIQKVEKGELDTKIDIKSQNEMGEIAKVINHMMDNLKEYIEQEYLLVIQNQKAEYRALQSQINPHFLYNTLNGFVALNRMGETKVLEKSIISLSHLFRYACKSEELSNVSDEIRFLKEYLELEKLKYEDRLEYQIWMQEECGNVCIPKLLLQPIVENSIVHGMGTTDTPIHITIGTFLQEVKGIGKVMVVLIEDDGCGFDITHEEKHVGIENVRIRAELFCKDVLCDISSTVGKGTKTVFVFLYDEEKVEKEEKE